LDGFPSKKGPVKAPIRLVKPEDSSTSLIHPQENKSGGNAVASETFKPKK